MSIDSKHDVSNTNLKNDGNYSSEVSIEPKIENGSSTSTTLEFHHSRSQSTSPRIIKEVSIQRPPSPITRHRTTKQENPILRSTQRARSNSPRKTFSYLSPDRLNLRHWRQHRRQLAKEQQDDRIYYENRQKLERLAKIAKEPSTYPIIHLEQERQRERHAYDHHRKLLKSYIPILQNNLCLVDRLANIKGVYDRKKMHDDFRRHQHFLQQDANNRQKSKNTNAQRPFILPKINLKN